MPSEACGGSGLQPSHDPPYQTPEQIFLSKMAWQCGFDDLSDLDKRILDLFPGITFFHPAKGFMLRKVRQHLFRTIIENKDIRPKTRLLQLLEGYGNSAWL